MKFVEEKETDVYLNQGGGVSIAQPEEECMHCGTTEPMIVTFYSFERIRAVAKEMLRLADLIEDKGKDVQ